jgi:hypothetical protein
MGLSLCRDFLENDSLLYSDGSREFEVATARIEVVAAFRVIRLP